MNFSEDFGDCPSSDELIPEHWEAEQVKTRYFDIHVGNGPKDGFSVFMKIDNIDGVWEKEDIIAIAIDKDKLDLDDAAYVDNVEEIDENEFLNFG